jgi:chitin-binding protein
MRISTFGLAVCGLAFVPAQAMLSSSAFAHGSMEDPISRVYRCFKEGPEAPKSDACKAVVDAGGTQPLYDWMEVNQSNANGHHKKVVPDGTLCGGGRDKYVGLDLPRKDWHKTKIRPNAKHKVTFTFYATTTHATKYFRFYVTRQGWDRKAPLTWKTLRKFATVRKPQADSDNRYRMTVKLPVGRKGAHVIYVVWQRSDSPEAFYSCSDVRIVGN